MATEVVMPQMGESIAEGTITRWLKKVGEQVGRDEPLFEISTDKVDAEIPSPAAGTLTQVLFNEGDTVEVNKVVAYIGEAGEASAAPAEAPPAEAPKQEAAAASAAPASQAAVSAPPPPRPRRSSAPPRRSRPRPRRRHSPSARAPSTRPKNSAARAQAPWCARSPPSTTSTSRGSKARAPPGA